MAPRADASSIEALVQRLRRGGRQLAQVQALQQLAAAAARSPANVEAIVAAGAVPALVQHFGSDSTALQRVSGSLLACLCENQLAGKEAFAAAGGLDVLLERLSSPDEDVQAWAAQLAGHLMAGDGFSGSDDVWQAMLAADSLRALVRMQGSSNVDMQTAAAHALRYLLFEQNWAPRDASEQLYQAGVVPELARCLESSKIGVRRAAVLTLMIVAGGRPDCKAAVVAAGAVPALQQLAVSNEDNAQLVAARAMFNLALEASDDVIETIVAAGAITALAGSLHSANIRVATEAAGAVVLLCNTPERSRAAEAAGVLPALSALQHRPSSPRSHSLVAVAQGLITDRLTMPLSAASPAQPGPAVAADQPQPAAAPASAAPARRPPAPRVCAGPGCSATRGLRRCGGCSTVRYCGEPCRNAHWRSHKAECRRLQAEHAEQAAAAGAAAGAAAERAPPS